MQRIAALVCRFAPSLVTAQLEGVIDLRPVHTDGLNAVLPQLRQAGSARPRSTS